MRSRIVSSWGTTSSARNRNTIKPRRRSSSVFCPVAAGSRSARENESNRKSSSMATRERAAEQVNFGGAWPELEIEHWRWSSKRPAVSRKRFQEREEKSFGGACEPRSSSAEVVGGRGDVARAPRQRPIRGARHRSRWPRSPQRHFPPPRHPSAFGRRSPRRSRGLRAHFLPSGVL